MIVVDASVAVKWFVAEPGSDDAADLLAPDAPTLAAPDLLLIEVTATFVRLVNERLMTKEDGALTIGSWTSAWRSGQVRSYRIDDRLIARAARLAIELGHPLKNCIYLALELISISLRHCSTRLPGEGRGPVATQPDTGPRPAPGRR